MTAADANGNVLNNVTITAALKPGYEKVAKVVEELKPADERH